MIITPSIFVLYLLQNLIISLSLYKGPIYISKEDQRQNVVDYAGHMASVASTELCHGSSNAAMGHCEMDGRDCVYMDMVNFFITQILGWIILCCRGIAFIY